MKLRYMSISLVILERKWTRCWFDTTADEIPFPTDATFTLMLSLLYQLRCGTNKKVFLQSYLTGIVR